jgi:predicted MPP superfamily phosphohydrolase
MDTLFRWIHLSDIHTGHGDRAYGWDQGLVLAEIVRDIARHRRAQPEPPIDVVLVTGDIANTGAGRDATEYDAAATWLRQVGEAAGVLPAQIYVVPGNHDVNRGVDRDDAVKQLVAALRDGTKSLDDALADPAQRALLARRLERYVDFAAAFGPAGAADPLGWMHRFVARSGLPVRLVGLNTTLLAASDDDQGKLRVGMKQIGQAFANMQENELVLALGHHPLSGGWLADQATIEPYLRRNVHALLTGHVHAADADESRSGAGSTLLRVVAGSAHSDQMPAGIPAGHGYSFGAVVRGDDGRAHVWITPRKWSEKNASFRPDVDNVPENQTYSDHAIALPLAAPAPAATASPTRRAAPAAVRVIAGEPVPIFISAAPQDDALRRALQDHLVQLRRSKKATFKHSQDAPAGGERPSWIAACIQEARIILLLISREYVAADEYYEDEIVRAVERHDRGEARVIPILLRAYRVSDEPFAKLQPLPRDRAPVEGYPGGQDVALSGIAREVGRVVAEMRGEPPAVER